MMNNKSNKMTELMIHEKYELVNELFKRHPHIIGGVNSLILSSYYKKINLFNGEYKDLKEAIDNEINFEKIKF